MNYALPPQQIMYVNGKASIDNLKLAPNASALIADTTAPIVWKCVADSLGNVTKEAFDITPHKSEEEIEKEALYSTLREINERLKKLEANHESIINRYPETTNQSTNKTTHANSENSSKSSGGSTANGSK